MTSSVAYTEAIAIITTALGVAEGVMREDVLISHAANVLEDVSLAEYGNLIVVLAEYASSAVKLVADISGRDATDLHRNIALALAETIHLSPKDDQS